MVMAVDEAGQHHMAGEIENAVRCLRQLDTRAHLLDAIAADENAAIADLAPAAIHRHQYVGMTYQHRVLGQPSPSASTCRPRSRQRSGAPKGRSPCCRSRP